VIVTHWGVASALLFLLAFTATAWILVRAFDRCRTQRALPP
jgi:hypothetical protein